MSLQKSASMRSVAELRSADRRATDAASALEKKRESLTAIMISANSDADGKAYALRELQKMDAETL